MISSRTQLRRVALILVFALLNQSVAPTLLFALTSGPTQPEVSSFQPAEVSNMVDPFTGDFQYNIPLLDVGGYPINISYSACPGMDEEASWVGLGWNLNPGVINRQMRGLPDDFSGDSITKTTSMRPDITTGVTLQPGFELKGIPLWKINPSLGIYYNTYRGYGATFGISPALSTSSTAKGGLTASLGLRNDSQNGFDLSPSIGITQTSDKAVNSINLSTSINSKRGLRDISISFNASAKYLKPYLRQGSTISLNGTTYTPTSPLPLKNSAFTFHGTLGKEFFTANGYLGIEGYRSSQSLRFNTQKQSAFGYLNSQGAKESDLLDFNRERHGLPWREYMPALPPAFGTYDLFVASGQGCSGQYRATRNDAGFFYDAFHKNISESASFGLELGVGNAVKAGADINVTTIDAYRQAWKQNNALASSNKFTSWDGKTQYEPVFFKSAAEPNITPVNDAFMDKTGSVQPIRGDLDTKQTGALKSAFQLTSNQKPTATRTFSSGTNLKKNTRSVRNEVWQYLNSREASLYALEPRIVSYKKNVLRINPEDFTCDAIDVQLNRTRYGQRHISEVTIAKADGSRYVYGIPAYNTLQKDVSFSVNGLIPEDSTGQMIYTAWADNSTKNNKGRDAYFNAEVIPPYTYAYLLTNVLSPDYIDRTGNGVTFDDYGSAVRLNYCRTTSEYKWRTPFGKSPDSLEAVARHMTGRKSDTKDNRASYMYGTKEIWNVHSIESATLVAQFYMSDRDDALGALGENGGLNTLVRQQKLDSIKLFSKSDLMANGDAATPLKAVHFEYDYSLCPGTPNSIASENGKLTLKKIWFTYGKSQRGALNAYEFSYNDRYRILSAGSKYKYNMAYVDRWGSYKVNPPGYPLNGIYPYALQDETLTFPDTAASMLHSFAGAWSLSKIELPSGGVIEIQYEPDDYAFVQDKQAGQMFFVKGFSTTSSPTTVDSFLYHEVADPTKIASYVWVDIEAMHLPNNTLPDTNHFKAKCLESIDNIWFHMDVKVFNTIRENITGYMLYDRSRPLQTGSVTSGNLTSVGIPVKLAQTDNNNPINPVTKAALQTLRLEIPELVYPGSANTTAFEALLFAIIGFASAFGDIFNSFENKQLSAGTAKEAGSTIKGRKTSWIRLCNPRFKKFGGGHRVKQIAMRDAWDTMTGKPGAVYGQRYSYTTKHKITVAGSTQTLEISSGVAAWEPTFGSEENLWKQPVNFNEKILLAPDNSYYVETPFGESLAPAAMVGYSEVKVENLAYATNKRMGAGWMVHQYYTSRDFPIKFDYSAPARFRDKSNKLLSIFGIRVKDHLSLSQGFTVETNDMHGKPKQESSYAQNGALIDQTSYHYKVDNPSGGPMHLNNKVKVVEPDGTIGEDRLLGLDIEVWNDFREEVTKTKGMGTAANLDAFWAFLPIILFTGKALLQQEDTRFRSAVTTKYIKRQGVLEKITKVKDGSTITTENLLWDSESGAVLATKTQNEFEDPIYQFTYPAHWAYDGMGMAYKNAGTQLIALYFQNGLPYYGANGVNPFGGYTDFVTEGDEFGLIRHPARWGAAGDIVRLTAYKAPGNQLRFYKDDGHPFNSGTTRYDLTLTRSGRRNMHNAPIGGLVSKTDPTTYATVQAYANAASTNNMVNASATTYRDLWHRDCACTEGFGFISDTINPYRKGMKGSWRPEHTYVNHLTRSATVQAPTAGITNIRTDGMLMDFVPFWDFAAGQWVPEGESSTSWVRKSSATVYDVRGHQNEEKDALGIFSAAQYGYQGNLNTTVVHNSKLRQSMFESFEDYPESDINEFGYAVHPSCDDVRDCIFKGHGLFDLQLVESGPFAMITDSVAHTGRFSFRVPPYSVYGMETVLDSSTNSVILMPAANDSSKYVIGPNSCIPAFRPTPGTYLLSAWVYTGNGCDTVANGPMIYVSITGQAAQQVFPSGPVIDGWQRIMGKINVISFTGNFQIGLSNSASNKAAFFDDVRFHPWLGNMKSFVYDPASHRLMATLDENNYATFYEYDDEGVLIRVKRETEKGVMTIKEHRSSLNH